MMRVTQKVRRTGSGSLSQLFFMFWKICRLQQRPQDLPASQFLVIYTLLGYMLVGFLSAALRFSLGDAVVVALIDTVLLALLSYIAVWIRLFTDRWQQTVTALAGAGSIIGLVSLPLGLWLNAAGDSLQMAFMPSLLLVTLMVWNLIIVAHVLKHALSVHILLGGVFAGFYMYIVIRIMSILFVVTN